MHAFRYASAMFFLLKSQPEANASASDDDSEKGGGTATSTAEPTPVSGVRDNFQIVHIAEWETQYLYVLFEKALTRCERGDLQIYASQKEKHKTFVYFFPITSPKCLSLEVL